MERTNQKYVPIAFIAVVLALLAGRFLSVALKKDAAPPRGLVKWVSLDEAAPLAASTGKPILYDFTADWCQPCHMLDAQVFQNAEVANAINAQFIPVRVVDRQREEGRNPPPVAELQQRYGVRGFPTVVFADAGGSERARLEGFRGREEFEKVMEQAR